MKLIVILGPTAVGKTRLATQLAYQVNGALISADSRQVYRGMDIGTGKDLVDFEIEGEQIPYKLIDIRDAGETYNLYEFQSDFFEAYQLVSKRKQVPILCGGSGLYLEAALAKKQLLEVPTNHELRQKLSNESQEKLVKYLLELRPIQHNTTDTIDRDRTIRAIEIASYEDENEDQVLSSPVSDSILFGIQMEREQLRARIEERLKARLHAGMIAEVEGLIEAGISAEKLQYYGLEYKFISLYLQRELSYDEMYSKLLQAIRRFAKKQMTWFRRMEKNGAHIHWMDADMPLDEKLTFIAEKLT